MRRAIFLLFIFSIFACESKKDKDARLQKEVQAKAFLMLAKFKMQQDSVDRIVDYLGDSISAIKSHVVKIINEPIANENRSNISNFLNKEQLQLNRISEKVELLKNKKQELKISQQKQIIKFIQENSQYLPTESLNGQF